MRYAAEIHIGGEVADIIETDHANEEDVLVNYPMAEKVTFKKLELNKFLRQKLEKTVDYISEINLDRSFFVQMDSHEIGQLEAVALFAIAEAFGYSCVIFKANSKMCIRYVVC